MNIIEFVNSRPDIFRTSISNAGIEVWAKLLNSDYLVHRAHGESFCHADVFHDVFISGDEMLEFGKIPIVKASFMLSEGM